MHLKMAVIIGWIAVLSSTERFKNKTSLLLHNLFYCFRSENTIQTQIIKVLTIKKNITRFHRFKAEVIWIKVWQRGNLFKIAIEKVFDIIRKCRSLPWTNILDNFFLLKLIRMRWTYSRDKFSLEEIYVL